MKSKLLFIVTTFALLFFSKTNFGQVISLGSDAAKFVIFTSSGAVGDNVVSHSHITGDVGTNTAGSITGFGNVNGVMHDGPDAATTACGIALAATIAQINSDPATIFPPSGSLGSGVIFTPGVYSIPGNATLTLDLTLDAQNDPNAEFIIKIGGTFSTNTLSRVKLINGALACHVYWQITGFVSMASLSTMRGNIISGGAITMGSGDSLEGRIFSTPAGAINIDGITAFTPIGCNSPFLTGPHIPNLASAACYTIFSSNGALNGNLSSTSIGDVGSNSVASVTGWNAGNVTGILHLTPDPSTIQCAIDVSKLYDTLNAMVPDIELLYPSQFGNNLVLTPHVYLMNSGGAFGPAAFTDSLYLDAQGNANGVFVIKIIGGALTTSTYSKVKLINGAQSKNVFWMVDGAVSINNYSVFRGTIVVSAGALNLVNTGVVLDGRALTLTGAITTAGLVAFMPPGSGSNIMTQPTNQTACIGNPVSFSIAASGSGITYQWRKGNINLINGVKISGVNSDTLKINPVSISDTASNYNVVITGGCSSNDTSINVSLKVDSAMIITKQPINQTVCVGSSVNFSIAATGAGLIYQWRKGNINLVNGVKISGANSDTLKINPVSISDTSLNYNVIITGACSKDTSIKVSLKVDSAMIITKQPINQTVCVGSSVNFSIAATGVGLTYQWMKGNVNLINGVKISGANSDTLKINPVNISDTSSKYNVVITGTCSKDTSIFVSLKVNPVYSINNPEAICNGNSYTFNGHVYTIAGNYKDTLLSIYGCDSIIVTQLTVNPVYSINNPQAICNGNSYSFNGHVYTIAGNYKDTLLSIHGCDSIIVTQLTVNPVYSINNPQAICNGNSYTFNGHVYTIAGNYKDTLLSIHGCDSIIVTQLTVNPVYSINNPQAICNGNSYTFNGHVYTITGNYKDTLLSINGCDSIIVTQLTVNPIPVAYATSNSPVCINSPIDLRAQIVPGGTYLWTGPNSFSSSDQFPEFTASTVFAGNYSLIVTSNGCSSLPSIVTVIVKNCEVIDFNIPEGFSPNGDGINDLFVIRGIDRYPSNTIVIYNRWGDKVFEASPYQNTWDGKTTMGLKVGGNELPIGTYFYVLNLGDGSNIYKGTIYLNR